MVSLICKASQDTSTNKPSPHPGTHVLRASYKNIGTIVLLLSGSGAEKYKCLVPGVSFDLYLSHMLSKTVVSALT